MSSQSLQEKGINAAAIRRRARQNEEAQAAEQTAAAAAAAAEPPNSAPKGKAKAKGKAARKAAGKKRKLDDDDALDSDFEPPEQSNTPVPGKITFCAECESRFTVTAYTYTAKDGDGMLCSKCGNQYGKAGKAVKKRRATTKTAKMSNLRNALDNNQTCTAKSLKDYCIEVCAGCHCVPAHRDED